MPPKHKSDASAGDTAKKRKTITIEDKVEIIRRSELGESPSSIGRVFGYSRSTIATILKDKGRIMEHVKSHIPMNATIITKQRSGLIIEMERLLVIWLEDQHQRNLPISLSIVQEKALSIFDHLKANHPASKGDCNEGFVASRGWFNRFKKRANLCSVKGEVVSADGVEASNFPEILEDIDDGGYLPQQIFNVVETGLFWKRMPERMYLSKEAKNVQGYTASQDRLTLLLGGNASGDFKLKPLLVHGSLNLRALRNAAKASLPVIWRANSKARVTMEIFEEWFVNNFMPAVEDYCLERNIPFKILLLLHHAPGHPITLEDMHPNVKVVFLPPNAASLNQPMDQGVVASFKAHYLHRTFSQAVGASQNDETTLRDFWQNYDIDDAIKNIAEAWEDVKETHMRGVWNKLCPQFAEETLGFTEDDIAETRQSVVAIANQLQLNITENDVVELLNSHAKLTDEDLMEPEQQIESIEENQELDAPPVKKFSTQDLADAFHLIEAGMAKLEEQDPDKERFKKVYCSVTESLRCYKVIYDETKKSSKQASLDACLRKLTRAAKSNS